jgi:hypothetical protein
VRLTERRDCLVVEVSDRLSAMETQRELVEYFTSLEVALNEHKEKGTPKETPRTAGCIPNSRETLRK